MNHVFTVTQVNSYIRRIFDGDYALRKMHIKGEVSNCKYHTSGHIYFTLKDASCSIRCVMFKTNRQAGLDFHLENGQQVTVLGSISVFERDGSYQLYAKEITKEGVGELFILYEKRKRELAKKGYFDFERKKELPSYPKNIGIVTALTGAAIEDIKSIAARRNPYVQLYLYPAKVQGEGAAKTIAEGIRFFDHQHMDIIIIGRGGGSIEDLWAFNELEVAEAIYQADTLIISGTGHEIDMTIADYCADVRAATPSAACELAIPDISQILLQIDGFRDSLDRRMERKLLHCRQQHDKYKRLLSACHPGVQIDKQRIKLNNLEGQLHRQIKDIVRERRHQLLLLAERLTAASPSARLQGGYVFAQEKSGKPINSVCQLTCGDPFELIFADGEAEVVPSSITGR